MITKSLVYSPYSIQVSRGSRFEIKPTFVLSGNDNEISLSFELYKDEKQINFSTNSLEIFNSNYEPIKGWLKYIQNCLSETELDNDIICEGFLRFVENLSSEIFLDILKRDVITLELNIFYKKISSLKLENESVVADKDSNFGPYGPIEYLILREYENGECFLTIDTYEEIDSIDSKVYIKNEGERDENGFFIEDNYTYPDKVDGVDVFFDGDILWRKNFVPSICTVILPFKVDKTTKLDEIQTWIKGNATSYSCWDGTEITNEEFNKIMGYIKK